MRALRGAAATVACPRQLNIRIGKRAPSDDMNEIRQDKNTQLASCFDRHRIPVDMRSDRTWDGLFRTFIAERAKKIFALIARYVIAPLAEMEAAHGVPSGIVDDDEKRRTDLDRRPNMIADGRVQVGERVYVAAHPDQLATIVSGSQVAYEGQRISMNAWGMSH